MLGGSTGKGTKVLAKLTGGTELVPKDSIGANDTLVLIGCEGTTVEVDCTCTKVFMQSCKDVRLVLRGKIITHTVECFKSDGCTLEFECKVFTAQLDLCTVRRPPGLKLNIPPRLFLYGAGVLTLSSGGRIAVRPPGLKLKIPPQLFLYGAGVLTLSSGGRIAVRPPGTQTQDTTPAVSVWSRRPDFEFRGKSGPLGELGQAGEFPDRHLGWVPQHPDQPARPAGGWVTAYSRNPSWRIPTAAVS